MAKDCPFIEERLSAYLDNQLGAEETAKVTAHLEHCPECAALLDKMKNLQNMAHGVLPDFDEAVLSQLEQRINREISKLPVVSKKKRWESFRIVPVWYRYAAVAASVAIIFLVGRMAFRESLPQIRSINPPVQGSPAPVRMNTAPTEEKLPPEKNELSLDKAQSTAAKKKAVAPEAKPSGAATENLPEEAAGELKEMSTASPDMSKDVSIDRLSDVTPASAGSEIEQSKTGVSKSAVSSGVVADSKMPAYEAEPDTAIIDTTYSKGFSLADLSAIYENIYVEHAGSRKTSLYDGYSSRLTVAAKNDSAGGVRKILSEYQPRLASTEDNAHLRVLYILMRSNYDVYRFTGDTMYYKQAAVFRDSVQGYFSSQVTFEPRN